MMLDDLLINGDTLVPFGGEGPDFALMGRVGNVLLVNGEPSYAVRVKKGEVARFYLTNTASSRTYNLSFSGAPIKVVASDQSRFEREVLVPSVVLAPAERYVIDVRFAQSGRYAETVAALAVMSELSLSFVEQAIRQERAEMIVVITKGLALSWQTAKAVLGLRVRNGSGGSNQSIEELMASFERLKTATARELIRFYRQREQHKPPRRSQA